MSLEDLFETKQVDQPPLIHGILYTKNYHNFTIYSDTGDTLYEFCGVQIANKCLSGDHISWDGICHLELRDEHPLLVGTLELSSKSRYGLTNRGHPLYLFTPYRKSYPPFIVGCSEKDVSKNKVALIKFDSWKSTFPRGHLDRIFGESGEYRAEKEALVWNVCPYKWPPYNYPIKQNSNQRKRLEGYTFNIDPLGCKDIDDVLTFEKIDVGWRITITISDVASYVEDGGAVDIMASLIGQTVYDKNGKVLRPMLPHVYSEQVCSLLPGKESSGISFQFIWDGQISEGTWFQSTFTNQKSYTYEEFNVDNSYKNILCEVASHLAKEEVNDSHQWIEQMMILYNTEAGKIVKKMGMGVLRRHNKPNMEKLEKYARYIPIKHLALSSAEYCLTDEDASHYGLSSEIYTHASSPIRRYVDLLNQRVLTRYITKSSDMYIVPLALYDINRREKASKQFARDLDFLDAIQTNQETKGIIIEKDSSTMNSITTISIYIPVWKRIITTTYKCIDGRLLSRDEKKEIDAELYSEVTIKYACNLNAHNWKERIIINMD